MNALRGDHFEGNGENVLQNRLTYSMAITRFVNIFVDQAQQGMYAKSVSYIANTLHMPPLCVEIRHEASHNQLPSIENARLAAELVSIIKVNGGHSLSGC